MFEKDAEGWIKGRIVQDLHWYHKIDKNGKIISKLMFEKNAEGWTKGKY